MVVVNVEFMHEYKKIEIRQRNRVRRQEENSVYGKKYSGHE